MKKQIEEVVRDYEISTSSTTDNSRASAFAFAGCSTPSKCSFTDKSTSNAGLDPQIYNFGAVVVLAAGSCIFNFSYNHRSSKTSNKERAKEQQ